MPLKIRDISSRAKSGAKNTVSEEERPAETRPSPAREGGVPPAAVILLLMAMAAGFSLIFFSNQSLRLDEAQSLWQTSRSPAQIVSLIAEDVHVPLYHLLLHFWRRGFGEGDGVGAGRLLSLLLFLATIPSIYLLGKLAYGKRVGIFVALLTAASPFLNWYGNEMRMYSLLALLAVWNQYFFIRTYKDPRNYVWWGYALTALIGVFTHYFFGLILLAQAAFYLFYHRLFQRGTFRKLAGTALLIGVLFLPWAWFVWSRNSAADSNPLLPPPSSVDVFNTFTAFLFGFQEDHVNALVASLWPLGALLGFLALRRNHRISPESSYFLLALAVPILAAFGLSFVFRPVYLARYLILSLPALYLLVGWLIQTYPRQLSLSLKTVLLAGMFSGLAWQAVSARTPIKEDYRAAVAFLNENVTARDVVILSAPFTVYPVEYYYRGKAAVRTLPQWNRFTPGPIPSLSEEKLPEEAAAVAGSHEKAWLLLSYDQGYNEAVRMYFDSNFERLFSRTFSPELNLYEYRLRYDVPAYRR